MVTTVTTTPVPYDEGCQWTTTTASTSKEFYFLFLFIHFLFRVYFQLTYGPNDDTTTSIPSTHPAVQRMNGNGPK